MTEHPRSRRVQDQPSSRHSPRRDPNVVALPSRSALAQMVVDAEKDRRSAVDHRGTEAHRVLVTTSSSPSAMTIITVDNFASQFGSTGPKVRTLLKEQGHRRSPCHRLPLVRLCRSAWSRHIRLEGQAQGRRGPRNGPRFDAEDGSATAPRTGEAAAPATMYVLQFCADRPDRGSSA